MILRHPWRRSGGITAIWHLGSGAPRNKMGLESPMEMLRNEPRGLPRLSQVPVPFRCRRDAPVLPDWPRVAHEHRSHVHEVKAQVQVSRFVMRASVWPIDKTLPSREGKECLQPSMPSSRTGAHGKPKGKGSGATGGCGRQDTTAAGRQQACSSPAPAGTSSS